MSEKKMGRPLVEGERRSIEIKARVTPTMARQIDRKRKDESRSDWLRRIIEKEVS